MTNVIICLLNVEPCKFYLKVSCRFYMRGIVNTNTLIKGLL